LNDLPFTGERFIPGTPGEIWVEHWHRYHFAARWCEGKRVLDVACGEGYGSALLARGASRVTGVDISPEAVAHAQKS
jgi:2-polyprenyl-3-methyl-5-hydroxy-6-metoxy-1,4-benzoquinol methylase